jgi:transposase, IS5 family
LQNSSVYDSVFLALEDGRMSVKRTGQLDFAESWLGDGLVRSTPLDRIGAVLRWYRFEKHLSGLNTDGPGRPGYPAGLLFKALLLQSLYGLSDPGLEEALFDRLSFRRFVGLGLGEAVPDHSTLSRFRSALAADGLHERLFEELSRQLDQAGLTVRQGTMIDATVIASGAARPPGRKKADGEEPARPSADPEAGFARRTGKPGFSWGYKAHVGVDKGSGLIRRVATTPGNVPDTVPADRLIVGDEREVLADAAYHTKAREKALKDRGVKARLMRRPNKHHPELPPRLKLYNRLIARRRAAVETTFATLKNRMGLQIIRYRGLAKAHAQIVLAAIAFNLRRLIASGPPHLPA